MMTVTCRSNRTAGALIGVMGALLLTPLMTRILGQEPATARVFGIVTYGSGGLLPGARVVFKNEQSGVETVFVTNDEGIYSALDVNPGVYLMEVVLPGFKKYQRKGLALR